MYQYQCCPLCGKNLYLNFGNIDTPADEIVSKPNWSTEHVLPKFIGKSINRFHGQAVIYYNHPSNIVYTHKKCNQIKGATIRFPYERGDVNYLLGPAEDFLFIQRHTSYLIYYRKYLSGYFRRVKEHYIVDSTRNNVVTRIDFTEVNKDWKRFLALYDSGVRLFQ